MLSFFLDIKMFVGSIISNQKVLTFHLRPKLNTKPTNQKNPIKKPKNLHKNKPQENKQNTKTEIKIWPNNPNNKKTHRNQLLKPPKTQPFFF